MGCVRLGFDGDHEHQIHFFVREIRRASLTLLATEGFGAEWLGVSLITHSDGISTENNAWVLVAAKGKGTMVPEMSGSSLTCWNIKEYNRTLPVSSTHEQMEVRHLSPSPM